MVSFKKASLIVLARAYYGGYMRVVLEHPTEAELPLLKGDFTEAVPICTDGRCEFNDRAVGHVCRYGKVHNDRDCCKGESYLKMPNKVKYRIAATDKGRIFFEEGVSRPERIYLLLEMKEWRWSLSEVNKLAALELPEFLSHERPDIRKAASVRLHILTVLGKVSKNV